MKYSMIWVYGSIIVRKKLTEERKNFLIMSDGALVFAALSFAASLLLSFYRSLAVPHGILFYCWCLFWAARICEKKRTGHIRTVMYLCFAPILGMAILLGSFLNPQRSAITIIILLCILPLFIIDKPWRNFLYQLLFAGGLFVICSYLAKDKDCFPGRYAIFSNLSAYVLGGNYFALADKIESAENYVLVRKEAQHDALTGTSKPQIR